MEKLLKSMGQRIREMRRNQDLTLSDVARMTGLTESLLSQVENSKTSPSITTLLAIARALNTQAGAFFETGDEAGGPVVRRSSRNLSKTASGVNYYLLTPGLKEMPMEVLFCEFYPRADTETIRHEGVECGVVISGKLEVILEGQVYVLNAGDSITIESTRPHRVRNLADGISTAIWIDSPPSF